MRIVDCTSLGSDLERIMYNELRNAYLRNGCVMKIGGQFYMTSTTRDSLSYFDEARLVNESTGVHNPIVLVEAKDE